MYPRSNRTSQTLILMIAIALMAGCKGGSEGGTSTSGGSAAGSGGSGASGSSKAAAGDFEGVVSSRVASGEGKSFDVLYYIKPDGMRQESSLPDNPGQHIVMIVNIPSAKMMTLMPERKMYTTLDLKELQGMGGGQEAHFPKLTATGKTETIAGHTCEHYQMGDEQKNVDMCVARGMGFFGMGGGSGGGLMFSEKMKAEAAGNPEWTKLLEGGAFPLKMTTTDGGKITMTSEVTNIERKKLDDSLFSPPPDYTEMKMPTGVPPIPRKTSS